MSDPDCICADNDGRNGSPLCPVHDEPAAAPPFDRDADGLDCFSPDPVGAVPCERCDCAPCTCGGGNVVRLIERTPESALKYWRELAMRKVTENAALKAEVARLKAELAKAREPLFDSRLAEMMADLSDKLGDHEGASMLRGKK